VRARGCAFRPPSSSSARLNYDCLRASGDSGGSGRGTCRRRPRAAWDLMFGSPKREESPSCKRLLFRAIPRCASSQPRSHCSFRMRQPRGRTTMSSRASMVSRAVVSEIIVPTQHWRASRLAKNTSRQIRPPALPATLQPTSTQGDRDTGSGLDTGALVGIVAAGVVVVVLVVLALSKAQQHGIHVYRGSLIRARNARANEVEISNAPQPPPPLAEPVDDKANEVEVNVRT
jgi:hypothetical protein